MIDTDQLMAQELDRLVPMPSGERADWADVRRRAGLSAGATRSRALRRRAVVVPLAFAVVAVAVAFTPVASAIGNAIGSFTDWISGAPGRPASVAEKATLDRDLKSWAGFPHSVDLRVVATKQLTGATVRLFAFRSHGTLCLRVSATGSGEGTYAGCLPLSVLRSAHEPAVVVANDYVFAPPPGHGTWQNGVAATVGLVSDAVQAVQIQGRPAVVRNGAFLYVTKPTSPAAGSARIVAVTRSGVRFPIPVSPVVKGRGARATRLPAGQIAGPTHVDVAPSGGTIGWLGRRDPVGLPTPAGATGVPGQGVLFSRTITPDPQGTARVVVSLIAAGSGLDPFHPDEPHICFGLQNLGAGSMGCDPTATVFARGPFTHGQFITEGSDQFETVFGVADDDVTSMRLFLANGQEIPVPLVDNAYALPVARAAFPGRLVAYNAAGLVVGLADLPTDGAS